MTAEYDRGASSRQLEVEAISHEGKVTRRHIGENSNRVFISVQIPNWYTVSAPGCSGVLRNIIAKRIDCPNNKIVRLNRSQLAFNTKGNNFGKQLVFVIQHNS